MLNRAIRRWLSFWTIALSIAFGVITTWPSHSVRADLDAHGGPVKGIAVSKDGAQALTASFDYSIILWDLSDRSISAELHGHDAAVNAVTFVPDGKRALSASDDGTVGGEALAERAARVSPGAGDNPDGAFVAISAPLGAPARIAGSSAPETIKGATASRHAPARTIPIGRQPQRRRRLQR